MADPDREADCDPEAGAGADQAEGRLSGLAAAAVGEAVQHGQDTVENSESVDRLAVAQGSPGNGDTFGRSPFLARPSL